MMRRQNSALTEVMVRKPLGCALLSYFFFFPQQHFIDYRVNKTEMSQTSHYQIIQQLFPAVYYEMPKSCSSFCVQEKLLSLLGSQVSRCSMLSIYQSSVLAILREKPCTGVKKSHTLILSAMFMIGEINFPYWNQDSFPSIYTFEVVKLVFLQQKTITIFKF